MSLSMISEQPIPNKVESQSAYQYTNDTKNHVITPCFPLAYQLQTELHRVSFFIGMLWWCSVWYFNIFFEFLRKLSLSPTVLTNSESYKLYVWAHIVPLFCGAGGDLLPGSH